MISNLGAEQQKGPKLTSAFVLPLSLGVPWARELVSSMVRLRVSMVVHLHAHHSKNLPKVLEAGGVGGNQLKERTHLHIRLLITEQLKMQRTGRNARVVEMTV